MARKKSKQKFTIRHPHIAALAVFIVIATVGSGIVMTGAYVTQTPTSHPVDVAAVDASFPPKLGTAFFIGSVTLANYGTVSASNVQYRVLVTNADNGGLAWQGEGRVTLYAGQTRTEQLAHFDIAVGTYKVKFFVDSAYDFNEADESNNLFENTFTVTR